jgi:long-chain acyl-CoA synthetase
MDRMNKILAAIALHAQQSPQKIALIGAENSLSYADLYARIVQLSQWIATQAVNRIGLSGENSAEWIMADLAAMHAGVTLVPLPAFFSTAQLVHVKKLANLQMILHCGEDNLSLTDNKNTARTPIENISALQLPALSISDTDIGLPAHTCKITFTSGTTGAPKGVCLSVDALERVTLALAETIYSSNDLTAQLERHLTVLPLSTLLENIAGVYVPLYLGKSVVVLSGKQIGLLGSSQLSLPTLLQVLNHFQPNSLIVLPQILRALLGAKMQGLGLPESLRFVALGGAHTSPELIRQARSNGIPVYEGYGLSECASVVSLNNPNADCVGSVGKPLSHVDVKIDDGAILIRGNVFSGYLGQPQMTADEWLNTGDLGYIDEQGFIHINGRQKNILISSYGRNISPEWVEAELHLCPAVLQAMIVGDARPYCAAIVVLRPIDNAQEMLAAHIEAMNSNLPDYAQVKKVIIGDSPFTADNQLMTDNGRLRRQAIVDAYQDKLDALYSE